MLMSRRQNARQYRNMERENTRISSENVAPLSYSYLGATVTNTNLINEEIKSILNLRNACHRLLQKLLYSRLLQKKKKIKIKV
jgi:hypothetical protein